MDKKFQALPIIIAIIALYVVVLILFLMEPPEDIFSFIIRICALLGFVSMAIAAIMTSFMVQLYKIFGKPFIKIHHFFAISGLILATIHPIAFAISVLNPLVFIPVFHDWILFWELAGRPALILLYVATLAGVLRKKIQNWWKKIHALTYIALFFGLIHGTLIGTSFNNIGIIIIFYSLFILVVFSLIYKRYKIYKRTQKRKEKV